MKYASSELIITEVRRSNASTRHALISTTTSNQSPQMVMKDLESVNQKLRQKEYYEYTICRILLRNQDQLFYQGLYAFNRLN